MPKSPNSTDKHVGSRVRMRRLMLDLNQTQLAEAIGVTFQQVQKYENGKNRISASRLQQISNVLQVPISFFFEGLPSPSEKPAKKDGAAVTSDVFQFLATSDGVALVKAYVQIKSPTLRRAIVHFVEDL